MTMDFSRERRWIHPKCVEPDWPPDLLGPFVNLDEERVFTIRDGASMVSEDDGRTWSEPRRMYDGPPPGVPGGGLLTRTQEGVLVFVYADHSTFKWGWVDEAREPIANVRSDVWSMRSLDDGETWTDRQQILDGYCGGLISIIATSNGDVVVPVPVLLYDPGRHETPTYVSADQGKTWTHSNIIDLGGHGHHDGADEGTVVELSDGRLLMILRTNWDYFWEALSEDGGRSWRTIRPTGIDASTAPGYLAKLASGRIALVWNRLHPQGKNYFTRRAGQASNVPASSQREELSIAFTEDDGRTWSEPRVFAVNRETRVSYPQVFERRPGELWITSRFQGALQVKLFEEDFV